MRSFLISVSALGLVACEAGTQLGEASSAQTATTRSVWHGGGASASFATEAESIGVSAHESRLGGKPGEAYANYYRNWADPSSYLCEEITTCMKCREPAEPGECPCGTWSYEYCRFTRYGWEYAGGRIPASAFRVEGPRAQLDATLVDGPDFWGERCTSDEVLGQFECAPISGESIRLALTWRANGESESQSNGTTSERFGKYGWHHTGKSTERSADFEGEIAGRAFAGTSGSIGTGINVDVSRYEAQP